MPWTMKVSNVIRQLIPFAIGVCFIIPDPSIASDTWVANLNSQIRSNPDFIDFAIQNVCVDTADKIVPGDPADRISWI